jgi:hypothetical protein
MAQFLRPIIDTLNQGYINELGDAAPLYVSIDESVALDADFVQTSVAPTDLVYVAQLTPGEDPLSSSDHVIRYRYAKSASGGDQVDLEVSLHQDYVDENDTGTEIANWEHLNIPSDPVTQENTLSGPEADSITDYASLFLRFSFNQP